jgi:hypothetical protein
MESRAQAGDEANGSFGAAEAPLKDSQSGVEPTAPGQRASTEGGYRRAPSEDKSIDRAPLAERMRQRR